MRLPVGNVLRVLACAGLAALSLPGVEAARAETDLVPPVAQLFSWDAASAPPAGPASCAASQAATLPLAELRRQAAMARIAAGSAEPGRPSRSTAVATPTRCSAIRTRSCAG
jgi:hypothetical protein